VRNRNEECLLTAAVIFGAILLVIIFLVIASITKSVPW
jgi:hypothetical protein